VVFEKAVDVALEAFDGAGQIQDTGKGTTAVADDLEAVLKEDRESRIGTKIGRGLPD
jgi:hypothetical protein